MSFPKLTSPRKSITLKEDTNPKERFRCPVRKFLALDLADKVFVEGITPESLDNRCVLPTANSKQFAIKPDKKNIPILRRMMPNGQPHSSEIWTGMSLTTMLPRSVEMQGTRNLSRLIFSGEV